MADMRVVAGEGDLQHYTYQEASRWVERRIKRIVIHPKFKFPDWDVALLELAVKLTLDDNSNIAAARLPPYPVSFQQTVVSVGGWDKQSQLSPPSKDHLSIDVKINPDQECENTHSW